MLYKSRLHFNYTCGVLYTHISVKTSLLGAISSASHMLSTNISTFLVVYLSQFQHTTARLFWSLASHILGATSFPNLYEGLLYSVVQ